MRRSGGEGLGGLGGVEGGGVLSLAEYIGRARLIKLERQAVQLFNCVDGDERQRARIERVEFRFEFVRRLQFPLEGLDGVGNYVFDVLRDDTDPLSALGRPANPFNS